MIQKNIFSYSAGTGKWHPDARKCVCRAAVCNPLRPQPGVRRRHYGARIFESGIVSSPPQTR